jgi:hypothetical protein
MSRAQPELPLKVVPPKRTDARGLAAKVFDRHGIKLGEDDPAFALVTLNELILRKLIGELLEQVDEHIKAWLAEFQVTMQHVEGRAGKVLAQQVRDSWGGLLGPLREEIAAARLGVQQIVEEIEKTYRVATLARWCAVGAVLAIAVFACGFWAGRLL